VVNVAHQLGASFGLAVLVAVSAMVGFDSPDAHALLAHRVSVALTAATVMLAVALCVVLALIVRWRSRIRD
jgi:lactate dehydrogenase-like 2-hydroxyacid dehydrogenase